MEGEQKQQQQLTADQLKVLNEFKQLLVKDQQEWRSKLGLPDNASEKMSIWGINLEEDTPLRDMVLLKFLVAREYKLIQSATMLLSSLVWRKEFNVDSILDEQFPEYYKDIGSVDHVDKEGRPVMFNYYCNINVDTVFKDGVATFLRWKVSQMERAIRKLAADNWAVNQMVVVHDYKNVSLLGMDKRTKQASKETIQLLQDNYPEMLVRKFFINVPWFFERLYAFFTAFTNERTKRKFIVCGNKTYRQQLLQYIDATQLPSKYGGMGSEQEQSNPVKTLVVNSRDSSFIELGQLEANTTVSWEFTCESLDIGFNIVKLKQDGVEPTLNSTTNVYSDTTKNYEFNGGSFTTTDKATYYILFNNSYSFMTKKTIYYHFKLNSNNNNNTTNTNIVDTTTPSNTTASDTTTTTTTSTTTNQSDQHHSTADQIDE